MVQRIAVLSDPHGLDPTLAAVLKEPDVQSADAVVVTGDLAAGPQPGRVLARLRELGERAVLVRGNADRELVALARGGEHAREHDQTPAVSRWAAAQLSEADLDLLARLPHPVTLELDGVGEVLFAHGSPRDDDEVVLVDTRPARWAQALADVPDTVRIVCLGHTHAPFVRLVDRRWIVNSGSTGMPYGTTEVPWVLLDADGIHLRSARVDFAAVAAEVRADSDFPEIDQWVQDYVLTPPSDIDALVAFGPRDGRDGGWNSA